MSIVEKIINHLTKQTGLPCYYQSDGELNRIFDNGQFPCVFFTLLQNQSITTTVGNLRERVQIAVFFVGLTQFDVNAIENERIIDEQRERAFRWLLSLRTSKELRLVSVNGSQRAYAAYDAILTGYAVNVTLEELFGVYECGIMPPVEDEGLQVMTDAGVWNVLQVFNGKDWDVLQL